MKDFVRKNQRFSLCGLNCGCCPMYVDHYCPGCGGGEGNQACAIARCSLTKGRPEYCFLCSEFPCQRYDQIDRVDSFVLHRNQLKDIQKAIRIGILAYNREQEEKIDILNDWLQKYNDGRKKTFYLTAVNLLSLDDLKAIQRQVTLLGELSDKTLSVRATFLSDMIKERANEQGLNLRLNKKPR